MTDIVWSLRNDVPCNGDIGCSYELCNQAADEITRLRAEVAWHVEDKNAWQDTQAAHLREVTRLIAEVDNLKSMVIVQEKLLRSKDAENERLRAEVSGLNQVFDAQWSADMRAIECWRKANPGNELVLPDHADLCLWLMEERTRLTAENERLTEWNREIAVNARELVAENERLRAALEPFALALAGNWSHQPDNLAIDAGCGIDLRMHFSLGDFRRARAALEGK